jgi:hypothetical protein
MPTLLNEEQNTPEQLADIYKYSCECARSYNSNMLIQLKAEQNKKKQAIQMAGQLSAHYRLVRNELYNAIRCLGEIKESNLPLVASRLFELATKLEEDINKSKSFTRLTTTWKPKYIGYEHIIQQ